MRKSNMRCLSVLVTAQTLWNLYKLAKMAGYGTNIGKVIDKLVREKMLSLRVYRTDSMKEVKKWR